MTEITERLTAALADRYKLEREIGRGGMATVYLAEDLRHKRKVALKVLHPELAAVIGAERFLREIDIAASLTNPHILPLHESGQVDGLLFYVMPYVEGESLRDRLDREKQLPVDQAVRLAGQVARALAHAHDRGVIHRDIKPENVLLSGEEAVVADFGIARAVTAAAGQRLTETGLSLGTPHYMSPEQAAGEDDLDIRTDIYSLGCVLYEMLAGDPPFTGPNVQAIIAKVLTESPPDLASLRETVSPELATVVHKSMGRLPADRFQTATQFVEALDRSGQVPMTTTVGRLHVSGPARKRNWAAMGVLPILAALGTVVVMTVLGGRGNEGVHTPMRFTVVYPDGYRSVRGSPPIAISPDGSLIVFAARDSQRSNLFLRRIDDFESHLLPGTGGAHTPFFSPDGQWIGYVGDRSIMRVSVNGGQPILVGSAPFVSLGAAWGPGTIVFGGVGSGLMRVPADGGTSEPLALGNAFEELSYSAWPRMLPDDEHVMFTVGSAGGERTAIVSLATGEHRYIDRLDGASGATLTGDGQLVYASGDELYAVAFDQGSLTVTGTPTSVQDDVFGSRGGTFARFSYFSLAGQGTLVFIPGGFEAERNYLVWKDLEGNSTQISELYGQHFFPHLSDDGRFIAVQENDEIWSVDAERGTRVRLTEGGGTDPAWTPDGRYVTYAGAGTTGVMSLYRTPSDGSGTPEQIWAGDHPSFPHDWAPDGTALAFYQVNPSSARDILILRPEASGWVVDSFLVTPYNERSPVFSPDGQWIAYASDESGVDDIYVSPYPGPGGKLPISRGGGREPVWSHDGRVLYYLQGNQVMAVDIESGGELSAGEPRPVLIGTQEQYFSVSGSQTYDVDRSGRRFLMTESIEVRAPQSLRVVVNWLDHVANVIGRR